MNNKNTLVALGAVTLLTLAACKEKDYTAYPPTWKGFRIERNGVEVSSRDAFQAGDSMRVTAVQAQKGRYINSTYYNWSLSCQVYAPTWPTFEDGRTYKDSVITKQYHTNYDGISNADPVHTFALPQGAQGRASVTFRATYNYSSDGTLVWDGSISGSGGSYSGSITSTSALLSGDARGSFYFNIQ